MKRTAVWLRLYPSARIPPRVDVHRALQNLTIRSEDLQVEIRRQHAGGIDVLCGLGLLVIRVPGDGPAFPERLPGSPGLQPGPQQPRRALALDREPAVELRREAPGEEDVE